MKLQSFLDRRSRRNDERGNMLIFILGLFLIMVAFVGLAIDTSITVHARQSVINELNSATVAAATQVNPNGTINSSKARQVAVDLYSRNRSNIPGMRCGKSSDGGSLQGGSACKFAMTGYKVRTAAENRALSGGRIDRASVSMTVRECSPNFFLSLVVKETCFNVTSVGRLSGDIER